MNRFSVLALLLAAALGSTYAWSLAGSNVTVAKSRCGCEVCKCPDCNGEFCTCDVCGCTGCGCAR